MLNETKILMKIETIETLIKIKRGSSGKVKMMPRNNRITMKILENNNHHGVNRIIRMKLRPMDIIKTMEWKILIKPIIINKLKRITTHGGIMS